MYTFCNGRVIFINMGIINRVIRRHDFISGKPSNYVIYRGQQYLEPGCVWAPYIPINLETEVFQPTQSITSRYPLNVVNSSNTQLFSIRSDGKITVSPDTLNEIWLPKVNRRFS